MKFSSSVPDHNDVQSLLQLVSNALPATHTTTTTNNQSSRKRHHIHESETSTSPNFAPESGGDKALTEVVARKKLLKLPQRDIRLVNLNLKMIMMMKECKMWNQRAWELLLITAVTK
jgi:hypothetical protein